MAEGYVFSSATDVNDLLNQIVSQAAVHGWSQLHLGGLGSSGRRGHISKDGVQVNLASQSTISTSSSAGDAMLSAILPAEDRFQTSYTWSQNLGSGVWAVPDVLCINASTGYDSAVGWYRQPGADVHSDDARNQGRFALIRAKGAIGKVYMFFFENPTAMLVIAEVRPGEFYWLAAGNLQKDYEFPGGQYYGASLSDTNSASAYPAHLNNVRIRIPHDDVVRSRGNGWGGSYTTYPSYQLSTTYTLESPNRVPGYFVYHSGTIPAMWSEVQDNGYDAATGRLWVHPPRVYAIRPDATKSYVGVLPHLHYSTLENFIGADIITLGGEEYMVFPANWRNSPYDRNTTTNSAQGVPWYRNNHYGSGFAVRKPA